MLTRAVRDYYAVLGVPPDADQAAIKRAFRGLASEWHPDVSDDPRSDERFRELVQAYEVLSRPAERQRYDRLGFARGSPAAPSRSGLFDDLLARRRVRPRRAERGGNVRVELAVERHEASRGAARGIRYAAFGACPDCDGDGGPQNRPCSSCNGGGRVIEERAALVRIPAGTADGDLLRLAGRGHAGGLGAPAGDLEVVFLVAPPTDPRLFRRIAAAGAICALVLLAVVLILFL